MRSWALGLLIVVSCVASPLAAQTPGLDPQIFVPTAAEGTTFQIARPEVLRHRTFVVGIGASMSYRLLDRQVPMVGEQSIVVYRMQPELYFALGLFEWIELGVVAPLVVQRSASDPFAATLDYDTTFGAGDIRLSMKVPILRGDFSLAAQLVVSLPAGRRERFEGAGYWSLSPQVVAAYHVSDAVTVTAELTYRTRKRYTVGDLEFDDELGLLMGGSFRVADPIAIIVEGQIRAGVAGRSLRVNEVPVDVNAGVRVHPNDRVSLDFGVGTGLVAGYGAPAFRGFAAFRYSTEDEPCAAGPEDYDGFEDGDFCADLDNDADSLVDDDDECPNDAEDVDEFLDGDGCADPDNDADGVLDATDRCPLESEDVDQFEDEDGCPEPDNDEDGIIDGLDLCPMEPEDTDSFQDDDGCPEPGPRVAVVTVTDTRILISERIYFEFNSEVIRSVSFPLLDQVAGVLNDLPADKRVRVEGYSDSQGNDQYNLDLSYRRARAVVEYLAAHGVPAERLSYEGYGEVNPIAPNDSVEGRALNRRVEFTIIEPSDVQQSPRPPSQRRR